MPKVRIECYLDIPNFSKIEAIRTQTQEKGYTKVLNHIIERYFNMLEEHNQKDLRFNKAIAEKNNKIQNLEFELRLLKGEKVEPKEENIKKAEKILEGVI